MDVVAIVDLAVRVVAVAVVGTAALVAATHWAVRRGALEPFGALPRLVRRVSDPLLRPLERRLVRRGANPQDAIFWLFGVAVVGGLLLITGARWITGIVLTLRGLAGAPLTVWAAVLVDWGFGLLMAALIVRVLGSWFGASPYTSRIMRLAHGLTDWIVNPIRRVVPRFGMIDVSPLVAYLALVLVRSLLVAALR